MSMHSDSVLDCRVYKLLFGICRNCNGAVHFARVISAIHKQSGHLGPPWHNDSRRSPYNFCLEII
jgi:hypothetical protein